MELESRAEFPATAYQLAEQYHVGRPLALHSMQPRWIRFFRVTVQVLPGVVMCVVLFLLVVWAIFLFQVIDGQVPDTVPLMRDLVYEQWAWASWWLINLSLPAMIGAALTQQVAILQAASRVLGLILVVRHLSASVRKAGA